MAYSGDPVLASDLLFRPVHSVIDQSLHSRMGATTTNGDGLEHDPYAAVEQAVGLIEDLGHAHGVEHAIQMTVATTDGESMWAFRYSSEGTSRSLFYSTEMHRLRALHPEVTALAELGDEARFITSEPLRDLSGAWHEVPESSAGMVRPGHAEVRPFAPRRAAAVL